MDIQHLISRHNFSLFDFLPLGVAVLQNDYKVVFWNKRLATWTGISSQEMLGSDIRDRFPRLRQVRYRTRIDSVFKGGAPAVFSAQIHQYLFPATVQSGESRLQNTTVCAYDKGDGTYCALFFCEDVTELSKRLKDYSEMKDRALRELEQRQQAESSLRRNESKLRGITDSSMDAIIMVDSSGRVNFWNPAAERMFGYTGEEALENDVHWLIAPQGQGDVLLKWITQSLVIGEGDPQNKVREMLLAHRSGYEIPVELSICPVCLDEEWFVVGTVRDISERKEYERQLRELANYDGLTGVSNRRHFMDLAEREVARAERYRESLNLLMLDLDHFKEVNDTYGHQVGDTLLRELASLLAHSLRKSDILGRVGGEEFAILLPNTSEAGALQAGEKLRRNVELHEFDASRNRLFCTVSLGVGGGESLEYDLNLLLARADEAMYQAKRVGRNRIECWRGQGDS